MDTIQTETKPLRNSPSVSSLSLSSKNILSFTKLRKSTSKLALQVSASQTEAPEAPTRELQQASKSLNECQYFKPGFLTVCPASRRNYVGNRNSVNLVKQPSLRRKGSTRAHAPVYSRKRPSTAPSATTSPQESSSTRQRRDEFPKPLGSSAFPMKQ